MKQSRIDRGAGTYSLLVALCACLMVLLVGMVDAAIDPFQLGFGWFTGAPTLYRPGIYSRVRLFKAYEVMRIKPQTVILGTSRSHIGFRCSHPALTKLEGPCYNLAFDGATAKEMYFYLRHAYAVRPLKHVLLGLDAAHLTTGTSGTGPDFDPLVLLNPDGQLLPHWLVGDVRLLTSMDTLKASIATLESQATRQPTWFNADGQRIGEVFFRQVDGTFKQLGPRGYLEMIDRREVGFQTAWMIAAERGQPAPSPNDAPDLHESSIAYVGRIIEFCRAHDVDLRITLTPAHVHHLEIAAATGAWKDFENGRRALVRLAAGDTGTSGNTVPAVPVFDFGGYSSITEEPVPLSGDDELKYYWDSSHFKQRVGDYVLDKVFDLSTPTDRAPRDFGAELHLASIEAYLAEQRARQASYRVRYAHDVAMLRELVDVALHTAKKRVDFK